MSEQLKFIVAELNREPYNKNYNLISFDALSGEQLLQHLRYVMLYNDNRECYTGLENLCCCTLTIQEIIFLDTLYIILCQGKYVFREIFFN